MAAKYVEFDRVMQVQIAAMMKLRDMGCDYLADVVMFCTEELEKVLCESLVEAVPREEYESLLKRFQHLLESDYIRSFDEVKRGTGEYKRDIREADRENQQGRWIDESYGYKNCSQCGCEYPLEDANGYSLEDNYCPDCGAKMKEVES